MVTVRCLRGILLLHGGPAIGGWRVGMRAGAFGIDNEEAYRALESAMTRAVEILGPLPLGSWKSAQAELRSRATPRHEGRSGSVDLQFLSKETSGEAGTLVLRAILPFRLWPWGGWAAYCAWHRSERGELRPVEREELNNLW